MTISCLMKCLPGKWLTNILTALTVVCFLGLGLSSLTVSAAENGEQTIRDLHDPLKQPSAIQGLTRPQPMIAVARAGDNLVSVGLRGLIMVSSDGGESWKMSPSPVSSDLVQVQFRDELNGWAVGHDSVLLATNDGGSTWEVRLDGRSLVTLLKDYYAAASDIDEYEAESLLGEVDLATSTSSDPDVMATPFLDVFVNDQGEGYLLGAFGMLLRTTDNGMTWQPWIERTENDRRMHLYSVDMHDEDVYISGEQGLVMRLDREQGRFVQLETPYSGTFFGIHSRDGLLMAYGLRGNLYVSRDQGDTWAQVETQQEASIVDALDDGSHFILVSQRGELVRLDSRNLETAKLRVPFTGEVSSAVLLGSSRELVVTQFSGVRKIDISKLQ